MNFTEYLNLVKEILNDNGVVLSTMEEHHQEELIKKFKKCFKDGEDVDCAVDRVMGWWINSLKLNTI